MSDLLLQKEETERFLKQKKTEEEKRFLEQQTQEWDKEYDIYSNIKENALNEVYEKRHYSFLERKENQMDWHFGVGKEIKKEAEPAVPENQEIPEDWEVLKPQEEMIQQQKELSKAEKNVVAQETKLLEKQKFLSEFRNKEDKTRKDEKKQASLEANYFKDKLQLIKLQAEADLEKAKTQEDKLVIDINKKQAIVDAWTDYVKTMAIGSPIREKAMKKKEDAQIDLYWAEYNLKLEKTEPAQKKKANAKYRRKKIEAGIKAIISKSDENCEEDHIIETEINGNPVKLINMGRVFWGGTKPTYRYKDMTTGKEYLYKKAENCCGIQKPEGAIVTEIGSKIQHIVDPEHEIPAIGIKDSKGKYIGSIQEIVDVHKNPTIDFDEWQLGSKEKGALNPDVVKDLKIQKQLLIFHCVDWLLCNFDTKGEHLLQRSDESFVSIDKEGGMNKILKDEAQHMSSTYCPHNHEPIYNVFFRMFKDKQIDIHPEALEALEKKVQAVEACTDEEYIKMFKPYIKQVNKKPEEMEKNILNRKKNLRAEYNKFLSELRAKTKLPDA